MLSAYKKSTYRTAIRVSASKNILLKFYTQKEVLSIVDRFLAPTDGINEELRQQKYEDIETMDKLLNSLDEAKTACNAWVMDTNKYYNLKRDIERAESKISELIFTIENQLQELKGA